MDELTGLRPDQLRRIYAEKDVHEVNHVGQSEVVEDAERLKKYAYSKFWEIRLQSGQQIRLEELREWKHYVNVDFMRNVAGSVIGEAARRDMVSTDGLRLLESTPGLTSFALRQVKARLALQASLAEEQLVDTLLALRATWAFYEILKRSPTVQEVDVLRTALEDPRLSRVERHRLREALLNQGARGR